MTASGAFDARGARPRFLLLAAIWLGLLAATAELAILGHHVFVAGSAGAWLLVNGQALWMTPLANAVIFMSVGIALLPLRATRPGRRAPSLGLGVLAFLAAVAVLQLLRLHPAATLLLAAGIAVQTARIVRARPAAFLQLARRGVPLLAGAFLTAGVATNAWWRFSERSALAALPASDAQAANVLLLILDTVRAKSLGLYGYRRATTPELETFARKGAVFEHAITPAPWTLPAHASMFTGRWPRELSTTWHDPLDATFPTLAEVLRAHGYATGGFVANIPYANERQGLARGFIRYDDYPVSAAQILLSSSLGRALKDHDLIRRLIGYQDILNRKRAGAVNRDVLDWIDSLDGRPYFAFLNYYEAHEPYLPKPPWDTMFGPKLQLEYRHFTIDAWLPDRDKLTPEQNAMELNAYEASIAELDAGIGRLLSELDRRGSLRNTLVIITSDHGEQFGEHGLVNHGNSVYMPLLHVPLVLVMSGTVPAGLRVLEPVSLRDLPATVLDLLGLPTALPGRSLAAAWKHPQRAPLSEAILAEFTAAEPDTGSMESLTDREYHLIRRSGGALELYDLRRDPEEAADLSASASHAHIRRRLLARLDSLGAAVPPRR